MRTPTYWLDLFTEVTWQEFLNAGGETSGFRESRWRTVQQIKPGDYLICYLTRVSRLVGILEVVSEAFKDNTPIWEKDVFPCRLKVKPVIHLTPETGVPITHLRDQLTIFENLNSPFAWTGHVRGSPTKWKTSDGEVIVNALKEAQQNPVIRPLTKSRVEDQPAVLPAKIGTVTVPGDEETSDEVTKPSKEPRLHTEIQWLLLKLGNDMGLDVWVANNDRSREFNGHRFCDLPPGLHSSRHPAHL
ncbi:EVE domain-containing protein [Ktedonobacter racemifer]|uniref:EVE domain-containing protein n=1 Tax=Ktedonobacter racemifer DSM 44963 TaxID=485913 RepID=D6TLX9_KTERA|nr:EVE domain-containing protein [Ktedonobacter racemifer]EFH86779.1 protein of unknown function DUF55 [Ktedonobacter racemifer DSM 44963]